MYIISVEHESINYREKKIKNYWLEQKLFILSGLPHPIYLIIDTTVSKNSKIWIIIK